MLISVSNKACKTKPIKGVESAQYFKDLKFTKKDLSINPNDFEEYYSAGYTFTYLYSTECDEDGWFAKSKGTKDNYIGTQVIIVDIDGAEHPLNAFIASLKYKPTFAHSSFLSQTALKGYKYSFHLYYCFDRVIVGEDAYRVVFDKIVEGMGHVDECAKDCHRCFYTSRSNLPTYQKYYNPENLYKVSDFIDDASVMNIAKEVRSFKSEPVKENKDFTLDHVFLENFYKMNRDRFLHKYALDYPVITETIIPKELYSDGYADISNIPFYKVPSSSVTAKSGNIENKVIKIGDRGRTMWLDGIFFKQIIPNITKEYLVYVLAYQAHHFYDNSDGELTNGYIIKKAADAWNWDGDVSKFKRKDRKFKVDYSYWNQHGCMGMSKHSIVNKVKGDSNSKKFLAEYDPSISVERNLKAMKESGMKTVTKKTAIAILKRNNIEYMTDKDMKYKLVIGFYEEDHDRSYSEIGKLVLAEGYRVPKQTVSDYIKEYLSNN